MNMGVIVGIIAPDRRVKSLQDLEDYSKLKTKKELDDWKSKKSKELADE